MADEQVVGGRRVIRWFTGSGVGGSLWDWLPWLFVTALLVSHELGYKSEMIAEASRVTLHVILVVLSFVGARWATEISRTKLQAFGYYCLGLFAVGLIPPIAELLTEVRAALMPALMAGLFGISRSGLNRPTIVGGESRDTAGKG